MINKPIFECYSDYDSNGNEVWGCKLTCLDINKTFDIYGTSTKTEARKECAFEYLRYLMDEYDGWRD